VREGADSDDDAGAVMEGVTIAIVRAAWRSRDRLLEALRIDGSSDLYSEREGLQGLLKKNRG